MLYRDPEEGYRIRVAELREERRQEIAALPRAAVRVVARRTARQAAGTALLVAGLVLGVETILQVPDRALVLILAWVAAAAASPTGSPRRSG
jgi:hypothetical protein